MNRLAILLLAAIPAFCGAAAVVASLTGSAHVFPPKAQATPVHSLDWLDAGLRIEVQPKSAVKLILLNGRTYQLSEGAKATISADGLTGTNSQVHELSRMPPIPRLAPIVGSAPEVAGATAIRNTSHMEGLYPYQSWAVATEVKLSFSPVAKASTYSVTLEDDEGNVILRQTTRAASVPVPADALKPGWHYAWQVRAFDASGVLAQSNAQFWTVSQDDLDRRSAFAAALASDDAATRLALLAGVDQQLGLFAEACDELESALRLRPADPALQSALANAKAALEAAREK